VVLAAAAWGEKTGTVVDAFGRETILPSPFSPPGTARTDAAILSALAAGLAAGPPAPGGAAGPPRGRSEGFFDEVELHFRMERRSLAGREVGTHVLFPEFAPAHSADGWLTRHLSWARHEMPAPRVAISPAHAAALGVREGQVVRLRSRDAEARLEVRIEKNLRDDVVLVPPHYPEVRRLTEWRLDPVLRDLDLRPGRVSVETLAEGDR
jgi:predicted molibdopterin-dependent oxidoreductase YjgC